MSRRELLREQTAAGIKAVARAHMQEVGTAAITMRAIARDLGMTPSGLYRYFDGRDALLTALITDAFDSLGNAVEAADVRARTGRVAHLEHILMLARAHRTWARANPTEYGLLFGSPVPGYEAPPDPTKAAAMRSTSLLIRVLREAHDVGLIRRGADEVVPGPFGRSLQSWSADDPVAAGLPPSVLAAALGWWVRMHGLLNFEVFGRLPFLDDLGTFFDREIRAGLADLGVQVDV